MFSPIQFHSVFSGIVSGLFSKMHLSVSVPAILYFWTQSFCSRSNNRVYDGRIVELPYCMCVWMLKDKNRMCRFNGLSLLSVSLLFVLNSIMNFGGFTHHHSFISVALQHTVARTLMIVSLFGMPGMH